MRRSLIYYWRINLAVIFGAAIATAVLTGALLVGDSVRGSLRQLTLERLGQIDEALVTNLFFRQDLAGNLAAAPKFKENFTNAVPAIMLAGSAVHPNSKARASNLNLLGFDQHFVSLFNLDSSQTWQEFFAKSAEQGFPAIALNEALQQELGAKVGDYVLVFIQQQAEIPRASLLGRRETSDLVKTIRCKLTHIIPNHGIGRFGLRPHQTQPLNAYVGLTNLQKALAQPQRVNALLVSRLAASASTSSADGALKNVLRENLQLQDLGVRLRPHENFIAVESAEIILNPAMASAVQATSIELQAPVQPILTYLANRIECNGRLLPYSTIAAITVPVAKTFGEFKLTDGSPATELAKDEILLNQWASQELGAQLGDTLKATYYTVGPREQLETKSFSFRVAGITAMSGFGADAALTPEFPGIHAANDMHEWNPPFPVDLNLIRPQDEAYWDKYRATPKAFIALETGQQLWNSRFGNLTSLRVENRGADFQTKFSAALLEKIKPEQLGFVFQPAKQQGLAAAAGATDFGMLFIGFSWFLIVAATLLVGMLFRLGVEQRAKEIGILRAVGFPARDVRRRLMQEGSILVGAGGLLGLIGAIGYAALLMFGLRTWWVGAVGAPSLFLHVKATSLIIGYIAALAVTLLAIVWTLRQLGKIPAPALLHGVTMQARLAKPRISQYAAAAAFILAAVMMALAIFSAEAANAGLFFGSGTCLLIALLALFSLWQRQFDLGLHRIASMAIRYGGRRPGRSLLSVALVGCACFVIVAVAANRHAPDENILDKNSGAGGFALAAKADIPLHYDLSTKEGRDELGFAETDTALLNAAQIFPLRLLPGEDASCLNLFAPQQPRILGVPADLAVRGGFEFQQISDAGSKALSDFKENPWRLLETDMAPDVIPAFGDYNSVQWILRLGLGKDLAMRNDCGEEIKLRFVGLFARSIFQSEVLISEANFLKHFPETSGYAYFLIETPPAQGETVAQTLEQNLRDYGFDAVSTATLLANFQAVENTYLSVFQTLGGLGLLLGTLGLGIILIRNVIERRGELALLRALGFRRVTLLQMLLLENSFLILAGILIGSVAALVAVAPHLASRSAQVPWLSLGATLLAVLLAGLLASVIAVIAATRIALLPALKAE
jgi:ABC-type antimicrobial peptide transport system permease subunit